MLSRRHRRDQVSHRLRHVPGRRRARTARTGRFAFDPREIAFVLLSHAHIDHSGLHAAPRRARASRGRSTRPAPTSDLLGVMLPDSAHLQEREAERRSRPLGAEPRRDAALHRGAGDGEPRAPAAGRVRRSRCAAPARALRVPRRGAHPRLGDPRGLAGRGGARRSSCSPATSASPAARSCGIRRRSPRPTCCWSSPPTATATTRASRRRWTSSPTR